MTLQATASASALLLECSYWLTPGLDVERDGGVGEAARYGTAFHSLIAWLLLNKGKKDGYSRIVDEAIKINRLPPSSSKELPGHVRGSYGVLLNWLKGKNPWGRDFYSAVGGGGKPKLEVEKSFAIRPLLGTVRPIKPHTLEDHIYPDLEVGEIAGTADLILGPLVVDHKTGSQETFHEPLEKAQLKTLGLIPLLRREASPILGVLHAPRTGLPVVYADEAPRADLDAHMGKLGRALERVGDGSMRPGPWCSRCPAQEVCPAQHGELLKRSGAIVAQAMGLRDYLDGPDEERKLFKPLDVGKVHQLLGQLEALIPIARKEIRQRVEDGEVIIRPDGKELALVPRSYERLSKSSILEALGKLKGEKEISRLRKLGAISKDERVELRAVDGS